MANKNCKNNHITRPTKSGTAKLQRQKVQAKRLVALGFPAAKLKHMTVKDVRDLLKYPAKITSGKVKV